MQTHLDDSQATILGSKAMSIASDQQNSQVERLQLSIGSSDEEVGESM